MRFGCWHDLVEWGLSHGGFQLSRLFLNSFRHVPGGLQELDQPVSITQGQVVQAYGIALSTRGQEGWCASNKRPVLQNPPQLQADF